MLQMYTVQYDVLDIYGTYCPNLAVYSVTKLWHLIWGCGGEGGGIYLTTSLSVSV